MSWVFYVVIILALGTVVSAILLLKQSARKFDLSAEQLDRIKSRNKQLDAEEKKNE